MICIILLSTTTASSINLGYYSREKFSSIFNHKLLKYNLRSDLEDYICLEHPLTSVPVIVEKNGNFTIQFQADYFNSLFVSISTAFEPIVDEFLLSVEDISNREDIWFATVALPPNVPEELYNLTILIEVNGCLFSDSRPRAVSVISEFSSNFSFIHITDLHVGDPRGFRESIRETLRMKSIKQCINEINLLHPDFVIISGDLTFGQLYPFEYSREYPLCYKMLQLFDVPTYLCPGNHDGYRRIREDGLEFWNEYFGPHYYSFNYGDHHFIACNSYDMPPYLRFSFFFLALNWGGFISNEQLEWISQDLNTTDSENIYMFMHHNPLWETTKDSLHKLKYQNREALLSLIHQYGVDMVLAGHVHYDNVTKVNDTIFLTTTTPESEIREEDGYWGYRLITVENDTIQSYNYKEPKYSIPSYHLKLHKKEHNFHSTAAIENKLDMDIQAYVKFTMSKGDYKLNNGEILLQRNGSDQTELYVLVNVEKLSTVQLKISPECC